MAGNNTRVNILVEGQTEETFVREVLAPHLGNFQVWATARVVRTSKGHMGGAVSFGKIHNQVSLWCKQDPTSKITTLFDLYGLPPDFPGIGGWNYNQPAQPQIYLLEQELAQSVNQPNFIPYLQLHEYESLLFSDLNALNYAGAPARAILELQAELAQFAGPEEVNNSRVTAPSKRLINKWDQYGKAKPLYGSLIAMHIGLPTIRQQCPRFNDWVTLIEGL